MYTYLITTVRTSPRIKRKPTRYEVSVVTRDEVGAYKPYLWEQSVFDKGPMFREWLLTKIVNGERASYSAPKFARMQERTRSQMLEDIVANLQNHAETGQIPKPYRRGSWRPIGHMRPSSPLLDSVRDQFEDYDQLAKDFTRMFLNSEENTLTNSQLFDVVFLVGQSKQKVSKYIINNPCEMKILITFSPLFSSKHQFIAVFNSLRRNSLGFEQSSVFAVVSSKRCYTEFRRVLVPRKFQSPNS